MSGAAGGRLVRPVPGRGLRRGEDGRLELPVHVLRPGPVSPGSLVLTGVEAEQLHAALCYALDGEYAPVDAPECRKAVRYPGGRQRY